MEGLEETTGEKEVGNVRLQRVLRIQTGREKQETQKGSFNLVRLLKYMLDTSLLKR